MFACIQTKPWKKSPIKIGLYKLIWSLIKCDISGIHRLIHTKRQMHEIKVSILHFLCLLLKRRTFHYQYHGGNKTQQHELRFQLLQNVDGNIVEYSHFHKKK